MSDYQVIARKFRPQRFQDVLGQEAIVTTLKNAIKSKRLAQAYLFSGSRGTGKQRSLVCLLKPYIVPILLQMLSLVARVPRVEKLQQDLH